MPNEKGSFKYSRYAGMRFLFDHYNKQRDEDKMIL